MITLKRVQFWNFFTQALPVFLLAVNFVFYNALDLEIVKTPLRILSLFLFIIGWTLRRNYRLNSYSVIFVLIAVFEILLNGISAINLCAIIILAIGTDNNIQDFKKNVFYSSLITTILMLLLLSLGITENYNYISSMGRIRSTLGFNNPNVAAIFYSSSIYSYLLLKREIYYRDTAIVFALATVIYMYSGSRTAYISLLFTVVLLILQKLFKRFTFKILTACMWIINVCFLMCLLSTFVINDLFYIDELLSFRISTFKVMIDNAGVFGLLFGGTKNTVDSFYYMFLFTYGLFAYTALLFMTNKAVVNLIKNNNYKEVIFITSFFVYGMMESSIIRPEILASMLVWKLLFLYSSYEK